MATLANTFQVAIFDEFLDAFAGARTNRELYKTILQWDSRIGGD